MVEILQHKNLATRFQILVEIAAMQPNIQQRYIAKRVNITPQAVSDYVKQLLKDGLITSDGRSRYRVSPEGVDWVLKQMNEAREYFDSLKKVVSNIKVSAALASDNLSKGQTVGLVMREGLLVTTPDVNVGAKGVVVSNAAKGDAVGVTNIKGMIDLKTGEVTILEVPSVSKGGSRNADLARLHSASQGKKPLVSIGIEALTALKRIGIQPDYIYGAIEVVIEAANRGLSPVIVCTGEEIPVLIRRLTEASLKYRILDLNIT